MWQWRLSPQGFSVLIKHLSKLRQILNTDIYQSKLNCDKYSDQPDKVFRKQVRIDTQGIEHIVSYLEQ